MTKLKLIDLMDGNGGLSKKLMNARDFWDLDSNPTIQYLTFDKEKAKEMNKYSVKNVANQLRRDLLVRELDPLNNSKYRNFKLSDLRNTLNIDLKEKRNDKECEEIINLIGLYMNLQRNIHASKVEIKCLDKAVEIAQEAYKIRDSEYGKLDKDKINYKLGIVYLRSGNPHAMNAELVGENPTNINDWHFVEPQSDGKAN